MPDFGPYEKRINIYKEYAADNWALRDCDCKELYVDVSSGDWKEWTKNDLKILATNKIAYDEYEFLVRLSVDLQKAAQANDTKKYAYAYNALTALAPKTMPTAEAFYAAIITTYTENKAAIDTMQIENKKYIFDVVKKNLIKHGAPSKLTKADLVAMNELADGKGKKPDITDFNGLLDVSTVALATDSKGQPTETALYAQKMLNELSPDGNWKTLDSAINQIMADEINKERGLNKPATTKPATPETKEQPKAPAKTKPVNKSGVKKAVAALDLQALQIDAAITPETPMFDQQAVVASLRHAGVSANSSDEQLPARFGRKTTNSNLRAA